MSSSGRRFDSVEPALRALGFPVENDAFIRRFTDHFGMDDFKPMSSYVKAVRGDGRKALEIHWGSTNGFASEAEVIAACGDVSRGPSRDRPGTWRVDHPMQNPGRETGAQLRRRGGRETREVCPECFTERSVSGTCSCP